MTPETILTITSTIIALFEGYLLVIDWKERNRIKAKEEIWNRNTQSIVNLVAKMQERIDKNLVQDAKELRSGIEAIAAFANGIHTSIKEELASAK